MGDASKQVQSVLDNITRTPSSTGRQNMMTRLDTAQKTVTEEMNKRIRDGKVDSDTAQDLIDEILRGIEEAQVAVARNSGDRAVVDDVRRSLEGTLPALKTLRL